MKPAGEWNHMSITSDRSRIAVELNGETVTRMNLDEWPSPNNRPDGTAHKFDVAYQNHPRKGYLWTCRTTGAMAGTRTSNCFR